MDLEQCTMIMLAPSPANLFQTSFLPPPTLARRRKRTKRRRKKKKKENKDKNPPPRPHPSTPP